MSKTTSSAAYLAFVLAWLSFIGCAVSSCGGEAASAPSATMASSSGDGGGAGGAAGGPAGCETNPSEVCGDNAFCSHGPGCEVDGAAGQCVLKPTQCGSDCPGACGCDGAFYCSECYANMAGVDVFSSLTCVKPEAAGDYSAFAFGCPAKCRYVVVRKADATRDVCIQLFFNLEADDDEPGFDFDAPSGAERAVATHAASDCDGVPTTSGGVYALGGTGSAFWQPGPGTSYPCAVDIAATLQFPADVPWLSPTEVLEAKGIPVAGVEECF